MKGAFLVELYLRRLLRQLSITGLILLLAISAFSFDVQAFSIAKTSKKYTITIHNANSATVISKGQSLKLRCTAKTKGGKRAKLKYKSSDKKVVSVSKKGVIKGEKNGKAKITVYVKGKGKTKARKTIYIRVGKPVRSIEISGYTNLRCGSKSKLKAIVSPSVATNKKVNWKSSNPEVVSVDSSGIITGKKDGQATITATAVDGSGKRATVTVNSHKYSKEDAKWIAHRGLHEKETENTAAAFEAAGKAGFWGCACDIYETKHVQTPVLDEEGEPVKDEEGNVVTKENFEIVIDHDDNFERLFGVNRKPSDMTAEEIRSNEKLKAVCFFDEYTSICKHYNMVPIVEIKHLSREGIEKMADMIEAAGMMEQAQFISFDSDMLDMTRDYVEEKSGGKTTPYVGYLLGSADVPAGIEKAKKCKYNGVNLWYSSLTEEVSKKCKDYNLKVCTWTYRDNPHSNHWLYEHVVTGKYKVDHITIDGKYFN